MTRCGKCGNKNPAFSLYCEECGSQVTESSNSTSNNQHGNQSRGFNNQSREFSNQSREFQSRNSRDDRESMILKK